MKLSPFEVRLWALARKFDFWTSDCRLALTLGFGFNLRPWVPDGKRFLVLTEPIISPSPMMLVLNWPAELGK